MALIASFDPDVLLPSSSRGGQLSHHPNVVYPRALSNIGYAYGHIKDIAEDEGEEEVINVKSTSNTKKWSDDDYEEEDHFFHSLYHNNDKIVTNVSTKKDSKDVDLEDMAMFKRLNDKIFHRRRGDEEKRNQEEEEDNREIANMKHCLEEILDDDSFFE